MSSQLDRASLLGSREAAGSSRDAQNPSPPLKLQVLLHLPQGLKETAFLQNLDGGLTAFPWDSQESWFVTTQETSVA